MADSAAPLLSLPPSPYEILPISKGGETALLKLQDFLKTVAAGGAPAKSLGTLSKSVDTLLDKNSSVEQDFIDLVRALVSLCPGVLLPGTTPAHQFATGIIEKLSVYNDLYTNKINPTQTTPAGPKMLGTYLLELGHVSQEQINQALADQKSGLFPGKRMGDILQAKGIITRAQLDEAIELQMVESMGG